MSVLPRVMAKCDQCPESRVLARRPRGARTRCATSTAHACWLGVAARRSSSRRIHFLLIEANATQPPHLPGAPFVDVLVVFCSAMAIWIADAGAALSPNGASERASCTGPDADDGREEVVPAAHRSGPVGGDRAARAGRTAQRQRAGRVPAARRAGAARRQRQARQARRADERTATTESARRFRRARVARNLPQATISSSTAACAIGYACHSTLQPASASARRDASAHANRTTGSCVPCAMKIGTSRLAGAASRGQAAARRSGRSTARRCRRVAPDAASPRTARSRRPARSRRARCARRDAALPSRARSAPRRAPATCARRPGPRAR